MMRRSVPAASRLDWNRADPLDLFDLLAVQTARALFAFVIRFPALGFAPPEGGAIFRGAARRLCLSLRLADPVEIDHRCHEPSRAVLPQGKWFRSAAGATASPSSPRRQLARTKSRIALDRLPLRSASMAANSALTDKCRRAAISPSASQKAASSDTLVACPAMRTECLTRDVLPAMSERCQAGEI